MHILKSVTLALILLSVTSIPPALADDTDDARAVAVSILRGLEEKKQLDVWNRHISNWFKHKMTQKAFLASMTVIHAQLGGVGTDRDIIQQGKADGDPQTGYKGTVYSFLFATTYPMAKAYETVVLIIEDNNYRLAGINYIPNPNP